MIISNICKHLRVARKHIALAFAVGLGAGSVQGATLTWAPAGGGDWDTVTANWTGDAATFISNDTQDVIFNKTAGGTIDIDTDMSPLSTTVSATSGNYTFIGGPLAGSGVLTKSGGGTLTFGVGNSIAHTNTYSGGTVIDAGTLRANHPSVTPFGSGPVTLNAGTLFLWRVTVDNPLAINGGSVTSGNGFGNNWNGPVTLNSDLAVQCDYRMVVNGDMTGAGGIIKTGGNELRLTGTNDYTGPTSVTAGTLQCDHPDALGSGDLSISSGGAKVNLNFTGTKAIGSLTLGGALMTNPGTYGSLASDANFKSAYFDGAGTVSSGDPATAAFIISFGANVSGSSAVIDPVVANAAAIAWIVPSGTNLATLAPDFVLTAGATCSERNSGVTPVPGFDAGTVVYTIVSPDSSVTNTYTVTATVLPAESTLIWNVGGGGAWDLATSNWLGQTSGLPTPFFNGVNVILDKTAGGTITVASGMEPLTTTVSATSGLYTFSGGPIATGSLIKNGGGTLQVGAGTASSPITMTNTFSGGTTINAGTLTMYVLSNSALGTGPVTLNGGTFRLERITATNDLTVNGGSIYSSNGFGNNWNGPITLNADFNCNTQYKLTCGNTVSGVGGFIKTGNSQLTLAGSNTFTGSLTVQAGTLAAASLNSVSGGTATSNLGTPASVANGTISLGANTSSGTLLYSGPGETTDRVIKLAGTTGGATLSQTGTPSGFPTTRGESGLLKFTSDVSIPGTPAVDNRKTLTLTHVASTSTGTSPGSGEISGSIGDSLTGTAGQLATSVTKAGVGTWTLSGANTYSGATMVQAGTLAFTRSDSLGGGALDITTGAKVRLDYIGTRQISALTFDAGTALPNGTYGSSDSIATHKDDTRFAGLGTVTVGAVSSPSTTTLARTAGSDPSNGGEAVTFTATVAGTAPTGDVRFYDGLTLIGIELLDGSQQASLTTSLLEGGVHGITAQYVGNAGNAPSASTTLTHTVVENREATTTTLASGTNPSSRWESVTFTATVAGTAPTGSVTFYDDATALGTATLNGSATASLTTSNLAVGWRAITARYAGDATHAPSASATPLFQTVDPPAGNGRVKVFILAGQSNMVAYGSVENGRNPDNLTGPTVAGGLGSLRNMLNKNPAKYNYLADPADPVGPNPGWITRSDVWVTYYGDAAGGNRRGILDADFGASGGQGYIGPEYGFGLEAGSRFADQVLIIKFAYGGKSLAVDYRPPGAVAQRGGAVGPYYTEMIGRVHQVLDDIAAEFPAYSGQGYEVSGFGWHQGWNDRFNATYVAEYEANLTNLIEDLRAEFGVPNMPVVVGNTGMANAPSGPGSLIEAQGNVADPAKHPEFAGTVFTVDTRPFDYGELLGVNSQGYHWYYNGESHFNIGERMGNAMMAMLPSANLSAYESWSLQPAQGLTAGVNDGANDDPDYDGIVNLLEFTLGGNPMVADASVLPAFVNPAGTWVFAYERSIASRPPAATQIVEYGDDLTGWTEVTIPADSAGDVTITPGGISSEHVEVALPALGAKGFARLKVSE